ncbi:SIMPL domain-containing protein [Paracoccus marinaquae]|uniref:SIMPL domain-containing protein n=1 Tax=Paracoccus marinaquae TaxID=2841926 RepID=A0ABS6AG03_9RHOB|nr:SIMPL domain-containing protein [Paracoccus marinaquae]MBU3029521.1 SIMPL domain-containing protein [Paracoccus marinaquae]
MIHPFRASGPAAFTASGLLVLLLSGAALAAPDKAGQTGRAMPAHCGPAGAMQSRLSVTGEGEVRAAPDMASIQLGVTSQADSAAEAMRQNSDRQAAVIAALTSAGIAASDIQTSGLNLNPMMDYGEGQAPRVTGYQAGNMVTVRVVEIAGLGAVLDAIVAAGANEIGGIGFELRDSAEAEDEARRAAVADARHKAGVMAEAAGLRLGPVLHLGDGSQPEVPRPMMRMAAEAAGASGVPVQAGELAIGATVQMEFALIGKGDDCKPRRDRKRKGADPDKTMGDEANPEQENDPGNEMR